jgi:hypothetical protein
MAKIWLLGVPSKKAAAEKSLQWCVDELGIHPDLWLSCDSSILERLSHLGSSSKVRYSMVEVGEEEAFAAAEPGWKSGYYLAVIVGTELMRQPWSESSFMEKPSRSSTSASHTIH